MPICEHPRRAVNRVRPAEKMRTAAAYARLEILHPVLRFDQFAVDGSIRPRSGGRSRRSCRIRGHDRANLPGRAIRRPSSQAGRLGVHGCAVSIITSAESRKRLPRPRGIAAVSIVTLCCPRSQTWRSSRARVPDRRPTGSTRITSAPRSASTIPAIAAAGDRSEDRAHGRRPRVVRP